MTTPNRQEIIDAYEALTELRDNAREHVGLKAEGQYRTVLEALPPKPDLTMADVEWDDDKHYLAEADHPMFGKVIMLGLNAYSEIEFFAPQRYNGRYKEAPRESLILTGKRFSLTEVIND